MSEIQRLMFVTGNACDDAPMDSHCCIETNDDGDLVWYADHKDAIATLTARCEELQAENARLKAPVMERSESTIMLRAYQKAVTATDEAFDKSHIGLRAAGTALLAARAAAESEVPHG